MKGLFIQEKSTDFGDKSILLFEKKLGTILNFKNRG